jgi:hypothetical protein
MMDDLTALPTLNRKYVLPAPQVIEAYAWRVWKVYHQQHQLPPPSVETVNEFKQFVNATAAMTAHYLNRSPQSHQEYVS